MHKTNWYLERPEELKKFIKRESDRFELAIVDAIFKAAPKDRFNGKPCIETESLLRAVTTVQALILASPPQRGKSVDWHVNRIAETLTKAVPNLMERPNPFSSPINMDMESWPD